MTLKETIAEALRKEGYDFMTAYEIAYNEVQEIKTWPAGEYVIRTQKTDITFLKS